MKHLRPIFISSLVATLAIAGCGGDGDHNPSPGGSTITFLNVSPDFSGDRSPLPVTGTRFELAGKQIKLALSGGVGNVGRTFFFDGLSDTDVKAGTAFDLSRAGNYLRYSEMNRTSGDEFDAYQGTLVLKSFTPNTFTLEFRDVRFRAGVPNAARGSFSVNGTYTFKYEVPPPQPGFENKVDVTFTGSGSISLDPMNFGERDGNVVRVARSPGYIVAIAGEKERDSIARSLQVNIVQKPGDKPLKAGDELPLYRYPGGSGAFVMLSAYNSSLRQAIRYQSDPGETTGTVTVLTVSDDGISLRLNNVQLDAQESLYPGMITVNGTISGKYGELP